MLIEEIFDDLEGVDFFPKGGKALVHLDGSVQNAALSWDAAGSGETIEAVVRIACDRPHQNGRARLIIRGSGTSGATSNGYVIQQRGSASAGSSAGIDMWRVSAGVFTNLGATTKRRLAVGTARIWMRLRAEGTSIKGKAWSEFEEEPSSWDFEVTDSAHSSGWVGLIGAARIQYFEALGVAIGGGTAPMSGDGLVSGQHYTDMSELDIASGIPDGWTDRWVNSASDWQVRESPTVPSGTRRLLTPFGWEEMWYLGNSQLILGLEDVGSQTCLAYLPVTLSNGRRFCALRRIGQISDGEILVRMRTNQVRDFPLAVRFRSFGEAGAERGYFAHLFDETELMLTKYDSSATNVLLDSASFAFAIDTWYWIRAEFVGTTLRAKAWADGDAEPSSWMVEATDSEFDTGYVGVGTFTYDSGGPTRWFSFFGVDSPELEPPEEPEPDPPPEPPIVPADPFYHVFQHQVVDFTGLIIPEGFVEVRRVDDGSNSLATIYDGPDPTNSNLKSNPFRVDENGEALFYAPAGRYDVRGYRGGLSRTWVDVLLGVPGLTAPQQTITADDIRARIQAAIENATAPASWNLPATITVNAGASDGVRKYAQNSNRWDIEVTDLATGLSYNAETESIEADAEGEAVSGEATFTLSREGWADVVGTTTVALEDEFEAQNIIYTDGWDTGSFLESWHREPPNDHEVTFFGCPPYGRPVQYGNQNSLHVGDGTLMALCRPGGGGLFEDGPIRGPSNSISLRTTVKKDGSDETDGDGVGGSGFVATRRRTEIWGHLMQARTLNLLPYLSERWFSCSVFVPSDFDTAFGSSWGILVWQFKSPPTNQQSPAFALDLVPGGPGNQGFWSIRNRWSDRTNPNDHTDPWQYSMFYAGDEGGAPYPRSNNWPDGLAHFPNVAASHAALLSVAKHQWTDWVAHWKFDARGSNEGGAGWMRVWKREGSGAWVQVLDIFPGPMIRGGMSFNHGIGFKIPDSSYGFNCGMYAARSRMIGAAADRTLFFDNVKVGNESATFADMSHDGSTP